MLIKGQQIMFFNSRTFMFFVEKKPVRSKKPTCSQKKLIEVTYKKIIEDIMQVFTFTIIRGLK